MRGSDGNDLFAEPGPDGGGREPVQLEKLLGEGGQGQVFAARCGGKRWALKVYHAAQATAQQRRAIEALIAKRPPSECFLWPQRLVTRGRSGGFGYLMELREPRFHASEDFMARKVSASFAVLMTMAYQLADSFARLHARGLAYSDISFGNIFFDPLTGDVRICDNDNVAVSGEQTMGVLGTPRFMAPEIVRGEAKPSAETDSYSLAVLLFYLLLGGHPLEGKLEAEIRCLDLPAMRKLYGESPLYIFDPRDARNRPVPLLHDNPRVFQPLYPAGLLQLFEVSFTTGLHAPTQRIMESQWRRAFLRARDSLQRCPVCQKQGFHVSGGRSCWHCKARVPEPLLLELEPDWKVVLAPGQVLFAHHLDPQRANDLTTVRARVTQHPNDPTRLGLRNEGQEAWTLNREDGTRETVAPGKNAPLLRGNVLHFGHKLVPVR